MSWWDERYPLRCWRPCTAVLIDTVPCPSVALATPHPFHGLHRFPVTMRSFQPHILFAGRNSTWFWSPG
jgi:hypothetical protein